jgi:hypothetical protein
MWLRPKELWVSRFLARLARYVGARVRRLLPADVWRAGAGVRMSRANVRLPRRAVLWLRPKAMWMWLWV